MAFSSYANKRRALTAALLVLVTAAALPLSACNGDSPPETLQPITVAWSPFESSALFYLAHDQGFFEDNGLEVTLRRYESGSAALAGALDGDVDIVVGTTEFPTVNQALAGAQPRILGCIARSEFVYIVGRKDRGLERPMDLRGKIVGTTKGTIAEFYLGRFLELNGLGLNDVTIVDLRSPEDWINAVVNGDIDAVCTAQPYVNSAQEGLGSNSITWSAQSSQPLYCLAMTSGAWLAANSAAAEKFLKSIYDAEAYLLDNPAAAVAAVRDWLDLTEPYLGRVGSQNRYSLFLDQSLIIAMEDETRWLISNGLTTAAMPDFLAYLEEGPLERLKPGAVRIIR